MTWATVGTLWFGVAIGFALAVVIGTVFSSGPPKAS